MPAAVVKALVHRCARSAGRDAAPDADLLGRAAGDPAALDELVRRHAGLVWGVCRRTLRQDADAEDAFQATFLALVRQAARIDPGRSLAGWLHTVATRVARKAQVRALKRPTADTANDPPTTGDVCTAAGSRELLGAVDAAIARLPRRLRDPVVLCCVEGLTRDEAAAAIGCTVAALKSRLERGRRLLRRLLEKRGVALPAAFLALGLGTARVSAALREKAIAAVRHPSPVVVSLAAGPFSWKLTATWAAFLTAGAVGLGVLGLSQSAPPKDAPPVKEPVPAARSTVDRLGDPLPEAALLRLGTMRFKHPGGASALALSPDGTTALTLGWEGLCAWDTTTGKERWRTDGRLRQVRQDSNTHVGETPMAILPDGNQAVMPIMGPALRYFDLATGKTRDVKVAVGEKPGADYFDSVAVAPDGKSLALSGPNGIVRCDTDGIVLARIGNTITGPRNPNVDRLLPWRDYSFARFAPDGKSLAVVTSDDPNVVRLCDRELAEIRRIGLSKRYLDSDFSPDGSLLAVIERDDTVRVYETANGNRKHEWPVKITRERANENYLFRVVFSPDGKTVVAGGSDKLLHLWDVPTGTKAGELDGHSWYPWGLSFTKDGKTLYSTGWDGDIRRWDLETRKQLPLPAGVRGSSVVAAAPDGRTLVYASDGGLRVVDAKTGDEVGVPKLPGLGVGCLTFSPDARTLAVGGVAGRQVVLVLIDPATGKVLRRWEWPKGNDPHAAISHIAFAPDGRRLAAISFRQHAIRLWDLSADRDAIVLQHPEGFGVAFSPDGQTLLTGGWDRKLRFWDPADGKLKREFVVVPPKPTGPDPSGMETDTRVYAVAWSPDGTRIAATDLGHRLWIWDADTLKVRAVTDTKDIPRSPALTFSPDGLWLATGGAVGKAHVWDGWTGKPVWDRGVHRADIYTVSFGRDSRTLLTGASDGLGYLWDLRPKNVPTEKPAALWGALVGSDGPAAYGAFWAMLDQPDAAVAAIAGQGQAFTATADSAQVRKWIADLDSPRFPAREAAEKALAGRLRAAVPELRTTLAKAVSAEQRERVRKLLDEWEGQRPRWSRAVSVLAHLGTPAAKDVLRSWADADPDGDLGRAAKAALGKQTPGGVSTTRWD